MVQMYLKKMSGGETRQFFLQSQKMPQQDVYTILELSKALHKKMVKIVREKEVQMKIYIISETIRLGLTEIRVKTI